ncbi:MAG: creatininase family protein [Hydrogenophaga sp.]|nr:creatininase family protein [Hydrogenophaga sp.]
MNPSRRWADWTARDFADLQASGRAAQAIAVLPIAAIEQHGPHLPVSVDTTLVDGVIDACLPHLKPDATVLFLPTQAVGKSNEHARYAGTLTLSADTLHAIWMELGACVARAGIGKLVLLNSHGGQVALMETVARDLRVAHSFVVVSTNWFTLPMAPAVRALFTDEEHRFGIHAGDVETSMMLALAPHTVHMDAAREFPNAMAERARDYPLLGSGAGKVAWQAQDLNTWGAAGDATGASAAKGQAVIDDAARQLAALLHEVDRLPPHTVTEQTVWRSA